MKNRKKNGPRVATQKDRSECVGLLKRIVQKCEHSKQAIESILKYSIKFDEDSKFLKFIFLKKGGLFLILKNVQSFDDFTLHIFFHTYVTILLPFLPELESLSNQEMQILGSSTRLLLRKASKKLARINVKNVNDFSFILDTPLYFIHDKIEEIVMRKFVAQGLKFGRNLINAIVKILTVNPSFEPTRNPMHKTHTPRNVSTEGWKRLLYKSAFLYLSKILQPPVCPLASNDHVKYTEKICKCDGLFFDAALEYFVEKKCKPAYRYCYVQVVFLLIWYGELGLPDFRKIPANKFFCPCCTNLQTVPEDDNVMNALYYKILKLKRKGIDRKMKMRILSGLCDSRFVDSLHKKDFRVSHGAVKKHFCDCVVLSPDPHSHDHCSMAGLTANVPWVLCTMLRMMSVYTQAQAHAQGTSLSERGKLKKHLTKNVFDGLVDSTFSDDLCVTIEALSTMANFISCVNTMTLIRKNDWICLERIKKHCRDLSKCEDDHCMECLIRGILYDNFRVRFEIEENMSRCYYCEKIVDKILICSRCHIARYCSKGCQRKDWKDHKIGCTSGKRNEVQVMYENQFIMFILRSCNNIELKKHNRDFITLPRDAGKVIIIDMSSDKRQIPQVVSEQDFFQETVKTYPFSEMVDGDIEELRSFLKDSFENFKNAIPIMAFDDFGNVRPTRIEVDVKPKDDSVFFPETIARRAIEGGGGRKGKKSRKMTIDEEEIDLVKKLEQAWQEIENMEQYVDNKEKLVEVVEKNVREMIEKEKRRAFQMEKEEYDDEEADELTEEEEEEVVGEEKKIEKKSVEFELENELGEMLEEAKEDQEAREEIENEREKDVEEDKSPIMEPFVFEEIQ